MKKFGWLGWVQLPPQQSQSAVVVFQRQPHLDTAIEAGGVAIICGHDIAQWGSLRKGIDAYR